MSSFTVPRRFKLQALATAVAVIVVFELLAFAPPVHDQVWVRLVVVALMSTAGVFVAVSLTGCLRVAWTATLSHDGNLEASTGLNLRHWMVPASTIWLIEVIESRYAPYGGKPLIQPFRSIEIHHAHGTFRVSRHVDHLGELIGAIKQQSPEMELKNRLDWPEPTH